MFTCQNVLVEKRLTECLPTKTCEGLQFEFLDTERAHPERICMLVADSKL